ncbi:hypothetical protein [Amycolatopsis granulosa]|uniref:hypothetical protein n=1 Tax=Amycolatopsis granulosa TaxID=185684 RepID=UPI0024440F87|nr:hypothetical protein [Amycolatopsis granulosa]NIH87011.1 hypothetical protein [Amycolatopsis granulosa]
MTGQQIYDNFTNAVGPAGLQEAGHKLRAVMKKYEVRSKQISSLSEMMNEGWRGEAASAASESVGRLAISHSAAADAMNTASDLIGNQSQAFFDTKNRVVPVPETFMTPSTLGQQIFHDSSFLQTTKVALANDAAKRNVEAMRAWTTTSGDNGSKMPTSYGTLDAGVLGVIQSSPSEVVVEQHQPTSDGPRLGGPGGASRGGGGAVTGATPSLSGPYHAPAGQAPADARTVAADAADAPSPHNPLPQGGNPGYGTSSGEGVPGYGNSTGYPGAVPPGERFGAGAGRGGIASGRGFGPGVGGAGGSGGAGRGFGPGSGGAGNSLAGGKRLGAANPAGAGESFARSGASGRGGAAGGPGAMGAGAGNRGKGEDDKDHQRKYIVDEDDHFQLTAEGEKAVDPITGLTVSSPVLGQ